VLGDGTATQKILDPQGESDWAIECAVDPSHEPHIELRRIGI